MENQLPAFTSRQIVWAKEIGSPWWPGVVRLINKRRYHLWDLKGSKSQLKSTSFQNIPSKIFLLLESSHFSCDNLVDFKSNKAEYLMGKNRRLLKAFNIAENIVEGKVKLEGKKLS